MQITSRIHHRIIIRLLILHWMWPCDFFQSWRPLYEDRGSLSHVAASGSDFNSGTQSRPWKTIQKAAATMTAGDTVLVHGGDVFEKVAPVNSGTEGKYIAYQNFGDGDVVIDAREGPEPGA